MVNGTYKPLVVLNGISEDGQRAYSVNVADVTFGTHHSQQHSVVIHNVQTGAVDCYDNGAHLADLEITPDSLKIVGHTPVGHFSRRYTLLADIAADEVHLTFTSGPDSFRDVVAGPMLLTPLQPAG